MAYAFKAGPSWSVRWRDASGRARKSGGWPTRQAAESVGRRLELLAGLRAAGEDAPAELRQWVERDMPDRLRAQLAEAGVIDEAQLAAALPLDRHADDFERALLARGRTRRHARDTRTKLRGAFEGVHAAAWRDVRSAEVEAWLAKLHKGGVSRTTVRNYAIALRSFSRWMLLEGRASTDRLARLATPRVLSTDLVHERRALGLEDLRRLFAYLSSTDQRREGLSASERFTLYMLAVCTGLRANEIRQLRVRDLDLSADPPTVRLPDAATKNRRAAVLPLRRDLAARLRTVAAFRSPAAPLVKIPTDVARALAADLNACGVGYVVGGRHADFHALRASFATILIESGVPPATTQQLMRHSDIRTTFTHYVKLAAPGSAPVEALPDFLAPPARGGGAAQGAAS